MDISNKPCNIPNDKMIKQPTIDAPDIKTICEAI